MDISLINYEEIEIPKFVEYNRHVADITDNTDLFEYIRDNIDMALKDYLSEMKECNFEEIDYPYEILIDQIAEYLSI